jgi:hypothetical protein
MGALRPDRYYLLGDAGSFFFDPAGDHEGFGVARGRGRVGHEPRVLVGKLVQMGGRDLAGHDGIVVSYVRDRVVETVLEFDVPLRNCSRSKGGESQSMPISAGPPGIVRGGVGACGHAALR